MHWSRTRAVVLGCALSTLATTATALPSAAAPRCGAFFDDFQYSSTADPAFSANGWQARGGSGGPGVPGATWSPDNIAFPDGDGGKVLQLSVSTDGSAGGTTQAELSQGRRRFYEGTYASRIRFTDAPSEGADGDHVNETYFAISPLNGDYDPLYSELDFAEYLPNGGWGVGEATNYQTSYHTYRPDPLDLTHRAYNTQTRSMAGWHELVTQVADGHVKYYIDGELTADHSLDPDGESVAPRQPMSLSYNTWLIDTEGHQGGRSTYTQQVAWTYYTRDEVVSPAEAADRAARYRAAGTHHEDTLDTGCRVAR
ncbi:hypothetical protein BC739_001408 [Kutzneria viridogrisea]|uniref:GH16 domain-containing protein n=1 Tax=Kutzneria viridogrisea TaxID=47990 RepID=A0ABR6BBG8_9PSEU|nr:hypothetical protein [Kutzneria viridogrisea]